ADTWFFATIESWMRLGRHMAPLANMANETPALRWLMEKSVGIDRRRPLPRLKRWKLRRRSMPTAHSTRPQVVLYTDLFARYNAPEIAQAAVDVLEHHGFEVEVPDVPW
ncbi:MAG: FAD-binding oxidoreductase, partial [Planctomycetota bacterium]|nr:FAD-binding oxidoreductase [Planctomycetota bacterium]